MSEPLSQEDRDMQLLEEACERLGEHFDTIQIFGSRHEAEIEGGTISASKGVGNWFARVGQVREWMIRNDEDTRQSIRDE